MPNQNLAMHCAHGCYDLTPSYLHDVETNQESRISRESLAYVTCASQYTFIFQIVILRDHHFLHTKTIDTFYLWDSSLLFVDKTRHYFLSIRFTDTFYLWDSSTLFDHEFHRQFGPTIFDEQYQKVPDPPQWKYRVPPSVENDPSDGNTPSVEI
jgi:hypothetical protein